MRARQLHPDAAQARGEPWDSTAFIRLSAAYEVLSRRKQRQPHDDGQRDETGDGKGSRSDGREAFAGHGRCEARAEASKRSAAEGARDGEWASRSWRRGRARRVRNVQEETTERPSGETAGLQHIPDQELREWRYGIGDWMLALRWG